MNTCKIFYSWQSDLPNRCNRGFIQKALENAAKAIRKDGSVKVEPVVDRDTAGVAGAPDIAATIFQKIDESAVFVCDVSIVEAGAKRPAPNPNVLFELGYAAKAMGFGRIVLVMNTAFGEHGLLPFDLRPKRITMYECEADRASPSDERKKLERMLASNIGDMLKDIEASESDRESRDAIEHATSEIRARGPREKQSIGLACKEILRQLDDLAPSGPQEKVPSDELLVQAIDQSVGTVAAFNRLAAEVAGQEAPRGAKPLYRFFEEIAFRFNTPGHGGVFPVVTFDFHRFVGHEMFTSLIALLMRESQWSIIAEILGTPLYVANADGGEPGAVPFGFLSQHVRFLEERNRKLERKQVSLHANILNERHTEGALSAEVPMDDFTAAECLLYLRSVILPEKSSWPEIWAPRSTIYMKRPPRFIAEAVYEESARQLVAPLGAKSVDDLRSKLAEHAPKINEGFPDSFRYKPFDGFDFRTFGIR